MTTVAWDEARRLVYEAGANAQLPAWQQKPADAAGMTLALPLTALTPLPAFRTSSVDGYAVRGSGPWRLAGRVLAGQTAGELSDGDAVEVATGAMVPDGVQAVIRLEDASVTGDKVSGEPRRVPEWREIGEEAASGAELLPAGTAMTPGVAGLAASCGYDTVDVRPKPRVAVLVFGDELAESGAPGQGTVRDALGPLLPAALDRVDAASVPGFRPRGPITDTLDAHVDALRAALDDCDVVCTTGGTMRGPVDHLHAALAELDADYVVNTVAVRPGYPMAVAALPGGRFVAALPGNPQSAVVALVSLVTPLLAGLSGRPEPRLRRVRLASAVRGRGADTHLALVRIDAEGAAHPVAHTGSSMLRGLAGADGFAVIEAGQEGAPGQQVRFLPLPGSCR